MKEMFKFCYSLEEINFGNFDLKNVTNIEEMFMYCVHLKKINLSLEGIEKIAKKDFCFYDCRALEEIDFESTKKLIWNDGNNLYHRTSLKDKFQKQYIKKFILGDKLKNVYIPILNFLNKTKYKVASDEFDVDYERRFYI